MRTCEAGACLNEAVYRGPRDHHGAAAWCEEHRDKSLRAIMPGDPKPEHSYWVELIPGAQLEVKP